MTIGGNQKYITICESIWGCVPINESWAKETSIYKQMEKKLFPLTNEEEAVKELLKD